MRIPRSPSSSPLKSFADSSDVLSGAAARVREEKDEVALKACQECDREISSDANPCPHCGKKNPHGASAIVKFGGGFLALMFGLPLVVAVCGGPSGSSSSAAATPAATAEASAPDIVVEAEQLYRDYDANEVAADNVYRGRLLAVSGVVSSIDKGLFDEPVLRISAGDHWDHVNAYMQKSEADKVATVQKGLRLTVVCKGDGLTIGSPILKDCILPRR